MAAIVFEKTENSFFLVPSELVDNCLDSADELQLKVILYLLRSGDKLLAEEEVAARFGVAVPDVRAAVAFWVKKGVLKKKNERYSINMSGKKGRPEYSAEDIAEKVGSDKKLRSLIGGVEDLYGRPLSPTELGSLTALYEWDGISPELIMLIVTYCFENGKKGFKYIEKTAAEWFESGIDTVEKAEAKIGEKERQKSSEYAVAKIIGAENRALTENEKKCIALWTGEYGFDKKMISKAYETTVEKTGKYSISYMNTVLKSWHDRGVTDEKGVEATKKAARSSAKKKVDTSKYVDFSWEILKNETENKTEK